MGRRRMNEEKALQHVVNAIRTAKDVCMGKAFKALHQSEGLIASAQGVAEWKRVTKEAREKAAKKRKREEKKKAKEAKS